MNSENKENKTAWKLANVFFFIVVLADLNDGGEFEKDLHEIYPSELELKK